jgi:hypothetical protein
MEVSGKLHTPAALPLYSMDMRLDGTQNRSERRGEEKILPLPLQMPDSNTNFFLGPSWGLTPRQAGRLTVGRNMTLTLT